MAIKISVGELFRSEPGTKKVYNIDLPVFDDEEFHIKPGQSIEIVGYNIDKGISLSVEPDEIEGTANCVKTLKDFTLETELYPAERQFYLDKPDDLDDDDDFDQIDRKSFEVDIEEMVRESVFLGLPTVLVSPEGQQMDFSSSKSEDKNTQKPFANLKDMLNE